MLAIEAGIIAAGFFFKPPFYIILILIMLGVLYYLGVRACASRMHARLHLSVIVIGGLRPHGAQAYAHARVCACACVERVDTCM